MNYDSFLEMVNIRFLLQKDLIAQLDGPKISLKLMSGIGKISFQREIVEILNDQEILQSRFHINLDLNLESSETLNGRA